MINDMCVNFVSGGENNEDVTAVVVRGSDDRMVKMFEIPSSLLIGRMKVPFLLDIVLLVKGKSNYDIYIYS